MSEARTRRTTRSRLPLPRDRGATAVEFALVVPVALMLIGTIFVFAMYMTYAALADHAARIGLDRAVIRTSVGYATEGEVKTTVDALFPNDLLGDPTDVKLTRQTIPASRASGKIAQGDTIRVLVRYNVPVVQTASGIIPFDGLRAKLKALGTVSRVAEGRAE